MLSSQAALEKATSLVELTVRDFDLFDEEFQPPTPILCPTLQELELLSDNGSADFCDLIEVPNLKALRLDTDRYHQQRTHFGTRKIMNVIRRSSCSLKRLILGDIFMTEPGVLSLLRLLSSLEELYLEERSRFRLDSPPTALTDGFFDALKGTPPDASLPNLRHLTIRSSIASPISSTFVNAMISRSRTGLPRLTVTFPKARMAASDVVRVQEHGLDFQFTE
jgi:hypothetical protein